MSLPAASDAAAQAATHTGPGSALGQAAAGGSTLASLGGMVLALVVVVGLILALAWVLRRLPGGALRGHGGLKLVASLAVGPRERVLVVDVGGEQLVLGVTSHQVSLLHRLEQPLPAEPPGEGFAALLAKRMQRDAGAGGGR